MRWGKVKREVENSNTRPGAGRKKGRPRPILIGYIYGRTTKRLLLIPSDQGGLLLFSTPSPYSTNTFLS